MSIAVNKEEMPRAKLFHNYEQVASCICPSVNVPAFLVSWFTLLDMRAEQGFFHFIHCHLMLNPNLLFDFEGNLQFIEVHTNTPTVAILGCVKGQSRRKSKALVTHSVLQMDMVHAPSRPALKHRAQERRPMNRASQLELAL